MKIFNFCDISDAAWLSSFLSAFLFPNLYNSLMNRILHLLQTGLCCLQNVFFVLNFSKLSDCRNNVLYFLHPSEGLIQPTQTMRLYVLLIDWGKIITIAHLLCLLKFTLQSFIQSFANDFEYELKSWMPSYLLNSSGTKLRSVFN